MKLRNKLSRVGGWLDYVKLRLAKASQLSWSWGLAWLSLAKYKTNIFIVDVFRLVSIIKSLYHSILYQWIFVLTMFCEHSIFRKIYLSFPIDTPPTTQCWDFYSSYSFVKLSLTTLLYRRNLNFWPFRESNIKYLLQILTSSYILRFEEVFQLRLNFR